VTVVEADPTAGAVGVTTRAEERDPSGPFRVALFAEQGHPEGSFRSGVTRLTRRIVEGCRTRRVGIDVFTYHAGRRIVEVDGVRYLGVRPRVPAEVHGLRIDALDFLPLPDRRFEALAAAGGYDIVLTTAPGIGTQAQLFARRRRIPVVAIYTTDLPQYAGEFVRERLGALPGTAALAAGVRGCVWGYLARFYHRRRTDLVLVPTAATLRALNARVDARAEVLGRGADTLTFLEHADGRGARVGGVANAEKGAERTGEYADGMTRPVRLLYVGRIDYGQKNLATLERVAREVDGAQLVVVGDGDDLPSMRQRLAREVAARRVTFTGRVDDAQRLVDLYLSADVFVFPSIYDTLGQVVLEAQRAGLPVVVRDRGGPPELVRDGRTGFVTASDDAFIARVRGLVGDAALRAGMGRAARHHAHALPTWDDVIEDVIGRLRRVAGVTQRRPASASRSPASASSAATARLASST